MARTDFEQAHGIKIEIIFEDSQGQAKTALSAFQKLTTLDKVDGIIGPLFQTEVAAISAGVADAGIPVITPSYAPIKNRPNPRNPLMLWMDPTIEAERIAEFVFGQGVKTVGIIGTLDSWETEVSNAFADKFTALGGTVLEKQIVLPDVNDVRLPITKIVTLKPEAIFVGTYYQFVNSIKVIRELGYTGKLYSIEVDPYLAGETKGNSDGMVFIAPDFYGDAFVDDFESRYGEKPGIPAGQAYDAAMLLFDLLDESRDKGVVLQKMEDLDKYEGVSGEITFTENHKTLLPTALFELRDGEATKIK